MDRWLVGYIDDWLAGWLDKWTDGWMDGWRLGRCIADTTHPLSYLSVDQSMRVDQCIELWRMKERHLEERSLRRLNRRPLGMILKWRVPCNFSSDGIPWQNVVMTTDVTTSSHKPRWLRWPPHSSNEWRSLPRFVSLYLLPFLASSPPTRSHPLKWKIDLGRSDLPSVDHSSR